MLLTHGTYFDRLQDDNYPITRASNTFYYRNGVIMKQKSLECIHLRVGSITRANETCAVGIAIASFGDNGGLASSMYFTGSFEYTGKCVKSRCLEISMEC